MCYWEPGGAEGGHDDNDHHDEKNTQSFENNKRTPRCVLRTPSPYSIPFFLFPKSRGMSAAFDPARHDQKNMHLNVLLFPHCVRDPFNVMNVYHHDQKKHGHLEKLRILSSYPSPGKHVPAWQTPRRSGSFSERAGSARDRSWACAWQKQGGLKYIAQHAAAVLLPRRNGAFNCASFRGLRRE